MNNNRIYQALIFALAIVGCVQLFTFSKKIEKLSFDDTLFYAAKSHEIPLKVDFCGEPIPLNSEDIRERFDLEIVKNAYWHSSILLFHKRAGKYFPVIEPILKQHNIPDDFKYLAIAESGLSNVVSPAGARGFWQFMEKTGKEYGLEINKYVDERYHLEKSTHAACKYLNDAYKKFGSWTLVAASYNMGMYGLKKNLERQKVNSYFDLLLNSETARYVFRIVAFKTLLTKPQQYGFNLKNNNRYKPMEYKIVKIDSSITNFTDFAIQNNLNYKLLKLANPWLRQRSLNNQSKKVYEIKIPTKGYFIYSDYQCYKNDSLDSAQSALNKILCADSIMPADSVQLSDKAFLIADSLKSDTIIEKINE